MAVNLFFCISGFLILASAERGYGLGESPKGVPYPDAWNGSAWTLGYEFLAYLLLIPLTFTPWVKKYLRWTVTLAFIASLNMYPLLEMVDATTNRFYVYARLIPTFLAGSLLYVWGQKVRVHPLVAIACFCLAVIVQLFAPPAVFQASQIFFAYGVLALAANPKKFLEV